MKVKIVADFRVNKTQHPKKITISHRSIAIMNTKTSFIDEFA